MEGLTVNKSSSLGTTPIFSRQRIEFINLTNVIKKRRTFLVQIGSLNDTVFLYQSWNRLGMFFILQRSRMEDKVCTCIHDSGWSNVCVFFFFFFLFLLDLDNHRTTQCLYPWRTTPGYVTSLTHPCLDFNFPLHLFLQRRKHGSPLLGDLSTLTVDKFRPFTVPHFSILRSSRYKSWHGSCLYTRLSSRQNHPTLPSRITLLLLTRKSFDWSKTQDPFLSLCNVLFYHVWRR